jgi:glutathione S-transferase
MKLYGALASPYVTRVLMLARIKGVDLPLAATPGNSPRSPEYLAFNPIGKIPSLDLDGRCLPESETICEYIEEVAGGKPALPEDPLDRATSRLISRIVDLYIAPNVGTFFRQMNPAARDAKAIADAGAALGKGFGFLEHFMGPGPFCVGADPTLGDCSAAPYMVLIKKVVFANFDEVPDSTSGDGRLAVWWQAIQEHPACQKTVEEYGAAVDGFVTAMAARLTGQK